MSVFLLSVVTAKVIECKYNFMATVYISLGSNVDAETNIRAAITALKEQFGELIISTVYKNSAVGFDGDDFLNLVVGLNTELSIPDFVDSLHNIEAAQGRRRDLKKFSPRTLDMDLLLYDDDIFESEKIIIPRDEITKYAFVLQPLAELIPDYIHPVTKQKISDLWTAFDKNNTEAMVVFDLKAI